MNKEIIQLNLEGELCPYPLILSLKKYDKIKKDMESGNKILEILTRYSTASDNIAVEFEKRGFLVSVEKIGPAKWKTTVKK